MATNTENKNVAEDEEIRPITIRDTETNAVYTLEFNAESVKFAESRGFDVDEVPKFPVLLVPELFWYAFRMHHKSLPREKVNKIFDEIGNPLPKGLVARLQNLYVQPLLAMLPKDDDEERKNTRMTVEF